MLADIHHWGRKGFKLVVLAEAKPFLTPGQGGDQGKKDPEREDRKNRQEHASFFPPVASEAQTLLAGKRKSLFFFYMVNLTQNSPWTAAGAPPCRPS